MRVQNTVMIVGCSMYSYLSGVKVFNNTPENQDSNLVSDCVVAEFSHIFVISRRLLLIILLRS